MSEAKNLLAPSVAILPWGDVIEDYLDSIGVTRDEFCQEMTGGWLFNYVDALNGAGAFAGTYQNSKGQTVPVQPALTLANRLGMPQVLARRDGRC